MQAGRQGGECTRSQAIGCLFWLTVCALSQLRSGSCTVQSGIDRLAQSVAKLAKQARVGQAELTSVCSPCSILCSRRVRAFEEFGERYEDGDMLFLHHLKRYLVAFTPESKVAFHETNR